MAIDWTTTLRLALALPGVEQKSCHDTPAVYVRGKIMGRLQEDGETFCIAFPKTERDELIERSPDVFSCNDHIRNYDYVMMDLHSANETLMAQHLEIAWRRKATKRAVAEFDAAKGV